MTTKTKHGRSNIPYERVRRGHGNMGYQFRCANPSCRKMRELSATKWIPEDQVCKMITKEGWVGRGHLQKGVPAYFFCPDCVEKKRDGGKTDSEVAIPTTSAQEDNVVDQLPRYDCYVRIIPTNEGLSRSLGVRIPLEVLEKLGKPTYGKFELNSGQIVVNLNPVSGTGVKLNYRNSGKNAELRVGSGNVPFKLPGTGPSIEAQFFVNSSTKRLISTQSYEGIYNQLKQVERQSTKFQKKAETSKPVSASNQPAPETETTERRVENPPIEHTERSREVPKPPARGGLSVDDGHALKEMMNQWLDQLEQEGFNPELEVADNRIKRIRLYRDI